MRGPFQLFILLSELVVADLFIPHSLGFDRNLCCGHKRVEVFWLGSFASAFYQSMLLGLIFPMTPDSIGIVDVAQVALGISVHGVCHSALSIRAGCT